MRCSWFLPCLSFGTHQIRLGIAGIRQGGPMTGLHKLPFSDKRSSHPGSLYASITKMKWSDANSCKPHHKKVKHREDARSQRHNKVSYHQQTSKWLQGSWLKKMCLELCEMMGRWMRFFLWEKNERRCGEKRAEFGSIACDRCHPRLKDTVPKTSLNHRLPVLKWT